MKKFYYLILFFVIAILFIEYSNNKSLKLERTNLLNNQKVLSDSIQSLLYNISVLSDSLHKQTQIEVNNNKKSSIQEYSSLAAKTTVKIDKKYIVYIGVDKSNNIKYVGITNRPSRIRFGEHLKKVGSGMELLNYSIIPGDSNLTEIQARIIEQTLINKYGLEKNGGQLLNKINSIAKNDWGKYNLK